MNSTLLLLLLTLISLNIVKGINDCKCSDYKTQNGCSIFQNGCYWENNQCAQFSSQCTGQYTQNTCLAPGCYWTPNNLCVSSTLCTNILASTTNTCRLFGCVNDPTNLSKYCIPFSNCSSITNQRSCDSLHVLNRNDSAVTVCAWHTETQAQGISSCIDVTKCEGLPLDVCATYPQCSTTAVVNTCTQVVCSKLTQLQCNNAGPVCLFQLNAATSQVSTSEGVCIKNNCDNYPNEIVCNAQANHNYCAWNGGSCDQCVKSSAVYKSIAVIFFMIVGILAF